MSDFALGDMARGFRTRRSIAATKADLERLTQELSTGRKTNIAAPQTGDFRPIAGVEHRLSQLAADRTVNTEAKVFWEASQIALGRVQAAADEAVPNLLQAKQVENAPLLENLGIEMRGRLSSAISALNTQFGGRSIFAGAATDLPALSDADTLMADVEAAVAGSTSIAEIEAALDTFFGPGGAFETTHYLGSTTSIAPIDVGGGIEVGFSARADGPETRSLLKGFAMGALVGQDMFGFDARRDGLLAARAAELTINAQTQMTGLRATIGGGQQRIEEASAAIATETVSFRLSQEDLAGVDPYQVAIELSSTEARLEAIYTVTARLAGLSLTSWLR